MIIEYTDLDALRVMVEASELKALALKNNETFRRLYQDASGSGIVQFSDREKPGNVRLYPVMYSSWEGKDSCFIGNRMAAVQELFRRWVALEPDTRQGQCLFGSRKFRDYMRDAGYLNADWIAATE